ncbi:hypothetical protein [Streptomyces sp. NPDC048295]|uniref:hypothetical protein n=1 Tax=Streptomyces sp. NPDC048295 TaxID=3154617 RepID=UPI00342822B4
MDGRLAVAVRELTGDTGPLSAAVADRLAPGDAAVREAARPAGQLGPETARPVPAPRSALGGAEGGRNFPQLDADVEIAGALCRITGDPEEAAPVPAGVLAEAEPTWTRRTPGRAAPTAARIGGAARPSVPAPEGLLDDRVHVPSVVLALRARSRPSASTAPARPRCSWTPRSGTTTR